MLRKEVTTEKIGIIGGLDLPDKAEHSLTHSST